MPASHEIQSRRATLFRQHLAKLRRSTDRLFFWLMIIQWFSCIGMAYLITPRTWIADGSTIHLHFWASIFLGAVLSSFPIALTIQHCEGAWTRHSIAIAQMLWSALLIHITGGRIETHFHVFGSLAILAFYRDPKVLITATVVVSIDHLLRGVWWPQSVFGIVTASSWRWLEHAAWILFEVLFLMIASRRSIEEVEELCRQQATLEWTNKEIEKTVAERTSELTKARDFFRSVVDGIDASICIVDKHGIVLETNASWQSFCTNLPKSVSSTQVGENYLHDLRQTPAAKEEHLRQLAENIQRVCQNGEQLIYEYPICNASTSSWFQARISPLNDQDGGVVIAHLDITNQIQANQRLQAMTQEAKQLALVARFTDNGVMITDGSQRIVWVNHAFSRITGFQADEIHGKHPAEFICETDAATGILAKLQQAESEAIATEDPLVSYRKSGERYWLNIEIQQIQDDGITKNFIAILRDTTAKVEVEKERAQLQAQLIDSSRKAGMAEMATSVLHNVGNVLNSVGVSANLIRSTSRLSSLQGLDQIIDLVQSHLQDLPTFFSTEGRSEHFCDYLKKVRQALNDDNDIIQSESVELNNSVKHIHEIVRAQQNYSRVATFTQPVTIPELIDESLRILEDSLNQAEIQVEQNIEFTQTITIDKHKLLQILMNLISNAKQAMQNTPVKERIIQINARSVPEHYCEIEIIDRGIGIPQDKLAKIFEHGYTTRPDGNGFGLHSCANLANQMGGGISVHCDGPGKGTEFCVRFSFAESAESLATDLVVT